MNPTWLPALREVRYVRWKAWRDVVLSAAVVVGGLVMAWHEGEAWPWLLVAFVGAVLVHIARLPLREPGVLLRLTPAAVWTRELGWRPWAAVAAYLERSNRGRSLQLFIHPPGDPACRFLENVAMLDIEATELQQWLAQYARPPVA